jgi:hypothetical protein
MLVVLSALLCANAVAQQPPWRAPRTADGQPDLQGMWTSATITPLERPAEYGGRRALTREEAAHLEGAEASLVSNSAKPTDLDKQLPGDCKEFGRGCGYNNFWLDRGSQVVTIDGEKRTSLLIDPPDGKIPPLTAERQQYLASRRQSFDGPEARRALPVGVRLGLRPADDAGALQQSLPDRAEQGCSHDPGGWCTTRASCDSAARTSRATFASGWAIRSAIGKARRWS